MYTQFRFSPGLVLFLLIISTSHLFAQEKDLSENVLDAINTVRIEHGLEPLFKDIPAMNSSQEYSRELASRRVLAHRDLRGMRVTERYRLAGGTGMAAGENLGAGDSLTEVIQGWLDSPKHRENMLGTQWHSAGIGLTKLPGNRVVIVAVFTNSLWSETDRMINDDVLQLKGRLHTIEPVILQIGQKTYTPRGQSVTVFSIPLSDLRTENTRSGFLLTNDGIVSDMIILPEFHHQ